MSKSFIIQYDKVVNRLPVDITIQNFYTKDKSVYHAIFDTGAMRSGISESVAEELHLENQGTVTMNTASSTIKAFTSIVNFTLPGDILFTKVNATISNLPKSIDAIIGMDILSCFDILITNSLSTSLSGLTPPAIPSNIAVNHFL